MTDSRMYSLRALPCECLCVCPQSTADVAPSEGRFVFANSLPLSTLQRLVTPFSHSGVARRPGGIGKLAAEAVGRAHGTAPLLVNVCAAVQ